MEEKMNFFGVYKIVFQTTRGELVYIGSTTVSFRERLSHHKSDLNRNAHHSSRLQRTFNKYKKFSFEIVEVCNDKDLVIAKENFYIENTPSEKLINFGPASPSPFFRKKHSLETRKKMSQSAKTSHKTPPSHIVAEIIKKLAIINKGRTPWNKGRRMSKEARQKIKNGMNNSDVKDKISTANKGKKPWNKGKTFEYKERSPLSEETKRKISISNKGKPAWNKGVPHTENDKDKMKRAWALRRANKACTRLETGDA